MVEIPPCYVHRYIYTCVCMWDSRYGQNPCILRTEFYTCVCVCAGTYTAVYACVHVCMCSKLFRDIHVSMYVCMYVQQAIPRYTCNCPLAFFLLFSSSSVWATFHGRPHENIISGVAHTYTHVYMQLKTCIYAIEKSCGTYAPAALVRLKSSNAYMQAYIHTVCVHTYMYAYIHTYMYPCTQINFLFT
jgi:hypothetical protein